MPSRPAAFARRLPVAAVGALATHALVYRSFWPQDGVHGYFGWYEPAVGIASLASLLGLVGALLVAVGLRRAGRTPRLVLRTRMRTRDAASASFCFLLVQESLERSVGEGRPAPAQFSPSQWLALVAGVAAVSCLLAALFRICELVVGRVLAPTVAPRTRRAPAVGWSVVPSRCRRGNPLAERLGLRAPPLLPS